MPVTYKCTHCREVMCDSCVHVMQRKGGPRCSSARFAATSANPLKAVEPKKKKTFIGFLRDTVKLKFRTSPDARKSEVGTTFRTVTVFQKPPDHFLQRGNPERMPVQTRNLREFPARRQKLFAPAHADFFQRFQTIRHERRADDQQAF
jgi:hypothetical protein